MYRGISDRATHATSAISSTSATYAVPPASSQAVYETRRPVIGCTAFRAGPRRARPLRPPPSSRVRRLPRRTRPARPCPPGTAMRVGPRRPVAGRARRGPREPQPHLPPKAQGRRCHSATPVRYSRHSHRRGGEVGDDRRDAVGGSSSRAPRCFRDELNRGGCPIVIPRRVLLPPRSTLLRLAGRARTRAATPAPRRKRRGPCCPDTAPVPGARSCGP